MDSIHESCLEKLFGFKGMTREAGGESGERPGCDGDQGLQEGGSRLKAPTSLPCAKPSLVDDGGCDDTTQHQAGDDQDGVQQQEADGGNGGDPQRQQPGKKKRGGAAAAGAYADPSSTLADEASLRSKDLDSAATFDADPLFGKTSKLFDENSAAGARGQMGGKRS